MAESPGVAHTVDEALNTIGGFGRFQRLNTLVTGLAWIIGAAQTMSATFTARATDELGGVLPGTVVHEWNLRGLEVSLPTSVFFFGWLIGCALFGWMSDRFGRKPTFWISLVLEVVFAALSAAAPTFNLYLAGRLIVGACVGGCALVSFVMSAEIWGIQYRESVGCLYHCFFSIGVMVTAAVATHVADWRTLTVVLLAPSALFIFCALPRWVSESPRWLQSTGDGDAARAVLSKIAATNKKVLPTVEFAQVSEGETPETLGFVDLFCNRKFLVRILVMMSLWFSASFSYYGLSLSSSAIPGSVYLNVFMSGLVEIPAYLVSIKIVERGRKFASLAFFSLVALCCFAFTLTHNPSFQAMVALLAKFGTAGAFAALYLFAAELFPTSVRNAALGASSLSARAGGILSPVVVSLGQSNRSLPLLLFALSSAASTLLVFLLPETRGVSLDNDDGLEQREEYEPVARKDNDDL